MKDCVIKSEKKPTSSRLKLKSGLTDEEIKNKAALLVPFFESRPKAVPFSYFCAQYQWSENMFKDAIARCPEFAREVEKVRPYHEKAMKRILTMIDRLNLKYQSKERDE